MISSIMLTGKHCIGVNTSGKIKVGDTILSVDKEIPFVRYKFESYDDADIEYIEQTMKKFKTSTHLVEIKLNEQSAEVLDKLTSKFNNVAKFIYFDVTDEEVMNKQISEEKLSLLDKVYKYHVDRYSLVDKTSCLDSMTVTAFKKALNQRFGIKADNVGICSSPLSQGENACLTAVKARELMSIYSATADVALPSANHQDMNTCGCIRYMVVNSDIEAPADTKAAKSSEKKTKEPKEPKEPKVVKPKNSYVFGKYNL